MGEHVISCASWEIFLVLSLERYTSYITNHPCDCYLCEPHISASGTLMGGYLLFCPGTTRPSTEHQLGARGVLVLHHFSSPFFLICKFSISFTGRLTTYFPSLLLVFSYHSRFSIHTPSFFGFRLFAPLTSCHVHFLFFC